MGFGWVIVMCQCEFILCNKFTTWVRDAIIRGDHAHVGTGAYGKSLYLPLYFAVNLNCSKQ